MGKSCKVVVCGQGSVGKTAVLEQLLYANHVAGECMTAPAWHSHVLTPERYRFIWHRCGRFRDHGDTGGHLHRVSGNGPRHPRAGAVLRHARAARHSRVSAALLHFRRRLRARLQHRQQRVLQTRRGSEERHRPLPWQKRGLCVCCAQIAHHPFKSLGSIYIFLSYEQMLFQYH